MRSILRVCVFSIAIFASVYGSAGALGNLGAMLLFISGVHSQNNTTTVNSTSTISPSPTISPYSATTTLSSIGIPTQDHTGAAGYFGGNKYLLLGAAGVALAIADQTGVGAAVNFGVESTGSALRATGRAVKSAGAELYQMVEGSDG